MLKSTRSIRDSAGRIRRSLRRVAATGAMLCWAALLLQLWLTMQQTVAGGGSMLAGFATYLAYFTILSNILAAITLSVAARPAPAGARGFFRRPSVQSGIALSMLVVGIVYNLLLRGLWEPRGWQLVADVVLHDLMPVVFLGFWFLAVRGAGLEWRDLPRWLLYPVGYFGYAVTRGNITGSYPYPFIDVASLGVGRVLFNALAMLVGFAALGAVLVMIDRLRFEARAASLQA